MTTKTILRRVEALEKEERFRKQQELRSLKDACFYAWDIVLAYYLGGLVSDDEKDICSEEKRGAFMMKMNAAAFLTGSPFLMKRLVRTFGGQPRER